MKQCCVCGSRRQRNLVTRSILDLKKGTISLEVKCKRCSDAYELLGNGHDRVHPEGSVSSNKAIYRYFNARQADRVGDIHE